MDIRDMNFEGRTVMPSEPWKDSIYLQKDVKPINYELSIRPLLEYGRFSGSEKITVEVLNKTTYFAVHAKELNITNCTVTVAEGNCLSLPVEKSFFYEPHDFYIILLEKPVNPGKYHLDFNFEGTLKDGKEGFFKSYYKSETKTLRTMAVTKFKLNDARRAYPCFDEPHLKATFKVKIVRPVDKHVVTNGIVEREEFGPEKNEVTVFFEETKPISTFATGFIIAELVGNYSLVMDNGNGLLTVKMHALADKSDKFQFAKELVPDLINFFTNYFGMPFPVSKLEFIALPEISDLTMEQFGYIVFKENLIMFDKTADTVEVMKNISLTVAREICRQWFGCLVTMKNWNDNWLCDGFVSLMKYRALTEGIGSYSDWNLTEELILDAIQPVMYMDSIIECRPININFQNLEEFKNMEYVDFISKKGLALLRMLESLIGAESFQKGVQKYIREYSYSSVNIYDFWNCLNSEVNDPDVNVASVMDTWTKQTGYPVIYVIKRANTWILSQSRFVLDRNALSNDSFIRYKWDVPLYYVGPNDKTAVLAWLRSSEECLKIVITDRTVSYLKFNYGQTGYYRVNYEGCLWKLFARLLVENHTTFSCIDRAGLIDDVFHLAEAGQTDYENVFMLISYMENENDFLPWLTVARNLKNLLNRFPNSSYFGVLIKYIRNIIQKIYIYEKTGLSWNSFPSESFAMRLFRCEMIDLATISKLPECMKDLADKFRSWIGSGTSPVSPDLFHHLICKGMFEFGTVDDWEIVLNRYKEEEKTCVKQSLLACLAHSREPYLILSLLSHPGSETIESDYLLYLKYLLENLYSRNICWNFLRSDFEYVSERVSSRKSELYDLITGFASKYYMQYQLEEVELFFEKHPEVGAENNAKGNVITSITRNMAFVKRNGDSIRNWLLEYIE